MKHITHKGYRGTVEYNSEDDLLIGKVVGIKDVVVYHGSTTDEIKANFAEAVESYLITCKELGKRPDREYKGQFVVRIDTSLHRKVANLAEEEGTSLNKYIENLLVKATGKGD